MMNNNNSTSKAGDTLDPKVLVALLILSIMEFEIFTHARGLVEIAKQDVVFSILLGGLFLVLLTSILVKLANRFPEENFFQYSRRVWGKPIASLITIAYLLYFFVYIVVQFQDFSNANRLIFLPETPVLIPMILLGIGAVWLASYGITAIVRFFQMLIPGFAALMLIILLLGIKAINFDNLLPLLSNGFMPILHGAVVYLGVIQGVEVLLFVSPFIKDRKNMLKPAILGVTPVILFMFFASINAISLLGVENIVEFVYPGIALLSVVQLPGFAVERFELFLTLPWLVAIFTTICIYIYLLSYGIIELFGLSYRKVTISFVTAAVIGATFLIPNMSWMLVVREQFTLITLLFIAVIPILTLFVAIIRGKEGTGDA